MKYLKQFESADDRIFWEIQSSDWYSSGQEDMTKGDLSEINKICQKYEFESNDVTYLSFGSNKSVVEYIRSKSYKVVNITKKIIDRIRITKMEDDYFLVDRSEVIEREVIDYTTHYNGKSSKRVLKHVPKFFYYKCDSYIGLGALLKQLSE